MNESVLELLQKATVFDLIITMTLISLLGGIILTQKKKIIKKLNKWRKDKNDEEDFVQLVYDLKDTVEKYQAKSDEVYTVMNEQSQAIQNLTTFMKEEQKKKKKTKRAEIKASIERIWWECHPTKTCTETQFEVLKDLIEEYEAYGGTNSFVHSTVQPEMYEWKRIKNIKEVVKDV